MRILFTVLSVAFISFLACGCRSIRGEVDFVMHPDGTICLGMECEYGDCPDMRIKENHP